MSTQYLQQSMPQQPQPAAGEALRTKLLENDEVLVVSTAYPPGGKVPLHTHRFPSIVCVIEGGTIETTAPGGTVETYDMKPGETLWSATPSAHSTRNVGSTPVRIVEIEVKHATPTAQALRMTERVLTPASLEWIPDPVDPRRSAALLVGDPLQPGPYTIRYRAPAGYDIGLHLHPDDNEQLTVISGTIHWSTGEAGSDAPEYALTAGAFALAPAGTPHRIRAVTDVVLQMSGIGPRSYVFLGKSDGSGMAH